MWSATFFTTRIHLTFNCIHSFEFESLELVFHVLATHNLTLCCLSGVPCLCVSATREPNPSQQRFYRTSEPETLLLHQRLHGIHTHTHAHKHTHMHTQTHAHTLITCISVSQNISQSDPMNEQDAIFESYRANKQNSG